MSEKTGMTMTDDDAGRSELHTADLVVSGRPAPAAEDFADDGAAEVAGEGSGAAGSVDRDRATDRAGSPEQQGAGPSERRAPSAVVSDEATSTALLGDVDGYRRRWEAVQTGFVDEPRRAVENADALVAEVMTDLANSFAQERGDLEAQWSQGDQVSTEDLRVSLRRYRSFFDRLLTT